MNEFSLIDEFFKTISPGRKDVVFGIGDDAACVTVPCGMELLVSTDTLVAGVHFLSEWSGYDVACKSLMVNISDMAAMAATPTWATLALTLPKLDKKWLAAFAEGLKDSLAQYHIDLIGGDTTQGPLSITITIMGLAPVGKAVRRKTAQPGDLIFVTGELGGAALAVHYLKQPGITEKAQEVLMDKLLHPKPRVEWCELIRKYASAAIDISDGLSVDLSHICKASSVGALLKYSDIPVHPLVRHYRKEKAVDLALTGGDDYELCFTVGPEQSNCFFRDTHELGLQAYPIGVIEKEPGMRLILSDNSCVAYQPKGYSHF